MGAAMEIGRSTIEIDPALPDYPTVVHALEATAARVPERTALICGDHSITSAQSRRAIAGYAHSLAARGVAGGRVALLMANSIEVIVASQAAMAARAQAAPMNAMYPPPALLPLLKDVDPTVLVCDAASIEMGRMLAEQASIAYVDCFDDGALKIELWIDDASLELPEPKPTADDPSLLFFTGGTTGLPKAADNVHSNQMAYVRATNAVWDIPHDQETFLTVAPNFHVWGYCFAAIAPIYMGAAVDIVPAFKPDLILKRFEEQKITLFAGGPAALFVGLRAHPNFKTTDFSNLKLCLAGGSPCSLDLLRGWEEEAGCPILEGWGMSEGAPINLNPIKGLRKPGTTGLTVPLTQIDIVDLETGETVLPQGERGEVRVRGPQFVTSYRNRPEENAETFRDGWLYTGDIGVFDTDGYLSLVDRKKEMILVGGYNVYPREVDEVLTNHPAVMEAAVIGVPDEFHGETVKACVALSPGSSASAEELIAHCAEHLVKYKVPSVVEFHDELPKTGSAKIDKLMLKGKR